MFLISDAYAEAPAAAAQQPDLLMSFLPLILLFGIMYFLLIRPQVKRQKEHKKMIDALGKGDEVVTSGGILGRITRLDDAFVTLEVANGVEIHIQRPAITLVMPKGTLRDLKQSA